ncbi:MAG: hypothetical protein IT379_35460 [Deltaproteobacteria bacterium]|nr:hypothetical protein [Deltaproteobacteria bacterium]
MPEWEAPPVVDRVAMIARWKPVHLGHAAVLEGLARAGRHVVVGIGSSNVYDARNPFTAGETRSMLALVLGDLPHVEVREVPDLGHGPRWRAMVVDMLGPLDVFFTANAYVKSLLERDYRVVHPVHLVPPERRVRIDGTMVRRAMLAGEDWRSLVPPAVAEWLDAQGLVTRFLRELGGHPTPDG